MATVPKQWRAREIEYPSGDGKPMAETELHLLFDPTEDYLDPPLQGFRLAGELYVPIEPIAGRLPSQVLGLRLERDGKNLRLVDPATGKHLLTPLEARQAAERLAALERQRAETAEAAQCRLAADNERLRREIKALRGG